MEARPARRLVLDEFRLDGRVAIVTGGAKGLGQAIATALAEAGADISLLEHTHPAQETADYIASLGRRVIRTSGSLETLDSIEGLVDRTVRELGGLDIVVNNAGVARRAPFLEYTPQDWDYVMNVNLRSVFFLSQAAARHWVSQSKRGKIINLASMLSYSGGLRVHAYAASKSGILGITRSMANELAPLGINVNAIAPGWIITDITANVRQDPVRSQSTLDRISANRWGEPDDVKGAVVFLASRASDYMHGGIVPIDGGWLAK